MVYKVPQIWGSVPLYLRFWGYFEASSRAPKIDPTCRSCGRDRRCARGVGLALRVVESLKSIWQASCNGRILVVRTRFVHTQGTCPMLQMAAEHATLITTDMKPRHVSESREQPAFTAAVHGLSLKPIGFECGFDTVFIGFQSGLIR